MKTRIPAGFTPVGLLKKAPAAAEETTTTPETIDVDVLYGDPDLIHVRWRNCPPGMRGNTVDYFQIALRSDPSQTLVGGSMPTHGRWGGGRGRSETVSVRYHDRSLCIQQKTRFNDWSETPKPLYPMRQIQDSDAIFVCNMTTTVTRTFHICDGSAILDSTLLEYSVQEGDTIADICEGLRVDEEWILNGNLITRNVSTIQIDIPNSVSARRFPTTPDLIHC
jgi:hypothetical protein